MVIVVGVSSRPEGAAALERAIEEARLRSARLVIVRTLGEGLSESPNKAQAWAKKVALLEAEGEALIAELRLEGIEAEQRIESVSRDPATVLLAVATEVAAELLIIGLRRRSPVGKLVMGSVAQSVLLGADCPVLTIKARDEP